MSSSFENNIRWKTFYLNLRTRGSISTNCVSFGTQLHHTRRYDDDAPIVRRRDAILDAIAGRLCPTGRLCGGRRVIQISRLNAPQGAPTPDLTLVVYSGLLCVATRTIRIVKARFCVGYNKGWTWDVPSFGSGWSPGDGEAITASLC